MNKLTVQDINLAGKKVIVRVDFNVPLDDKLQITDDRRIQESLPTIKYLLDKKASNSEQDSGDKSWKIIKESNSCGWEIFSSIRFRCRILDDGKLLLLRDKEVKR